MPEIAQTADHALRILEELGEGEPLSLRQLASRLELSRSAVHRLLATLAARGFVLRTNDSYEPGPALLRIGAVLKPDVRAAAAEVLPWLSGALGETVVLHVPDHMDAVVLYQSVATRQLVQVSHRIGSRHPLTVGASGRAILSFLSANQRRRAIESVAEPGRLERSLAEIRRSGIAVSHDEIQADVHGLAAPVRDGAWVVASVGVLVPVSRADRLPQHAQPLREAADRIAAALTLNAAQSRMTSTKAGT